MMIKGFLNAALTLVVVASLAESRKEAGGARSEAPCRDEARASRSERSMIGDLIFQ